MSTNILDEPIYPDIKVQLTGEDGNGFFIVSRTARALSRGGVSKQSVDEFRHEATSRDYDHLLATVQKWVTVL